MSVPAWPMPIQKTKLVMSKAHATGTFEPHTPTPVEIRYVAASTPPVSSDDEIRNAGHHQYGCGFSVISLICVGERLERRRPPDERNARQRLREPTERRLVRPGNLVRLVGLRGHPSFPVEPSVSTGVIRVLHPPVHTGGSPNHTSSGFRFLTRGR